jgi:hypothetical protein
MKYFGEPQCHLIDYEKGKEVFCFDNKGEFETDDPKIIQFMKKHKWWIKNEETENALPEKAVQPKAEIKFMHCKKCDFETDNSGLLMAHYRKSHPKEG